MFGILEFLRDVLQQPALLIGMVSFVGLLALRKPFYKIMTGTLKPILGYLMLGAGAGVIVSNLDPLGKMIEKGFHITGVVPNNEAIVSVAQKLLAKASLTGSDINGYAIHPGGRKILEAAETALEFSRENNKHSYEVLRNFGNMSSASILFVLEKILMEKPAINENILGFAFGPGLTVESVILKKIINA